MSELTFSDLRAVNVARCEEVFHAINEWSPTDWACAMAGECGEACNEIKKLRRLDGADNDEEAQLSYDPFLPLVVAKWFSRPCHNRVSFPPRAVLIYEHRP